MALQIRRGTDSERQLIIPLQGELIFTTDTKKLYIGDGTTLGGVAVDTAGTGGGASILNDLTDVTISSVTTGQVLKWNGSAWVNSADNTGTTISSINDITDVVITSPSSGQVLKWNGSAWVNDTDLNDGTGSLSLEGLTNVDIVSPSIGEVLKFDGFNWVNDTDLDSGTSLVSLNEIIDVTIDTPVPGQVLKWNGTSWINSETSINDNTDVFVFNPNVDDLLKFDGLNWVNGTLPTPSLDDLSNTNITSPSTGDLLSYDGVNWTQTNTITTNITSLDTLVTMVDTVNKTLDGNFIGTLSSSGLASNLDVVDYAIVSSSGKDIKIEPNALGRINLFAKNVRIGDPNNALRDGSLYIVKNAYSSDYDGGVLFAQHHETADAVNFNFYRTRGTSVTPTIVQNGDDLADLSFIGYDGTKSLTVAGLTVRVTGTPAVDAISTEFAFQTIDTGTFREPLKVASSGLVTAIRFTATNNIKFPVYADDTARNTAIPTPEQGMVIFMQAGTVPAATNQLQIYDGANWVSL